ncbi:MAG TPA: NINE protein [Caldimonas sp.]|nr:NINE protein [Caldimonas sp.]
MTETVAPRPRSRAVATWLAVVAGTLGAHRFYLHGARDAIAWLHLPPTLIGAYGWWRMREFGVDDARGSLLVLFLGAVVAAAMLQAIVYGLASDERWAARFGIESHHRRGWPVVLAVVLALAVGAGATMATIAFAAQRYFESRADVR